MWRTPASTWRSGSSRCDEEARAGFADGAAWARAFAVDVNSIAATPDMAVPSMGRRCRSIGSWQISAPGSKFRETAISNATLSCSYPRAFGVADPLDYRHDGRDIRRYS